MTYSMPNLGPIYSRNKLLRMLSPEVTASSANPLDTLSDPRQKGKGHLDCSVDWVRDG
jgi:hypothetical protein